MRTNRGMGWVAVAVTAAMMQLASQCQVAQGACTTCLYREADVVLVMDGSESVAAEQWQQFAEFAAVLVNRLVPEVYGHKFLSMDPDQVMSTRAEWLGGSFRLAVVAFATNALTVVDYQDFAKKENELLEAFTYDELGGETTGSLQRFKDAGFQLKALGEHVRDQILAKVPKDSARRKWVSTGGDLFGGDTVLMSGLTQIFNPGQAPGTPPALWHNGTVTGAPTQPQSGGNTDKDGHGFRGFVERREEYAAKSDESVKFQEWRQSEKAIIALLDGSTSDSPEAFSGFMQQMQNHVDWLKDELKSKHNRAVGAIPSQTACTNGVTDGVTGYVVGGPNWVHPVTGEKLKEGLKSAGWSMASTSDSKVRKCTPPASGKTTVRDFCGRSKLIREDCPVLCSACSPIYLFPYAIENTRNSGGENRATANDLFDLMLRANTQEAFVAQPPEKVGDFKDLAGKVDTIAQRLCFTPSCPVNMYGVQLYEQTACRADGTADRVCAVPGTCDVAAEYQTSAPTAFYNIGCAALTEPCPAGEYERVSPAKFGAPDFPCACPEDTPESASCANQELIDAGRRCADGNIPTWKRNRECSACDPSLNQYSDAPGLSKCKLGTQCTDGEFEIRALTATSNRVCGTSKDCFNATGGAKYTKEKAQRKQDAVCMDLSDCPPGTYVHDSYLDSPKIGFIDRVCFPCPAGQYSDVKNTLRACKPHSECNCGVCCTALTAECQACSSAQSVTDYCADNPTTEGCPKDEPTTTAAAPATTAGPAPAAAPQAPPTALPTRTSPPVDPAKCCETLTKAECNACAAGQSVADWCAKNAATVRFSQITGCSSRRSARQVRYRPVEYEASAPSASADRVCTEVSTCTQGDTFEAVRPSCKSDRRCQAVAQCGPGEGETKRPTAYSDRECKACEPPLTYKSRAGDRSCSAGSRCIDGEFDKFVTRKLTATQDRQCGRMSRVPGTECFGERNPTDLLIILDVGEHGGGDALHQRALHAAGSLLSYWPGLAPGSQSDLARTALVTVGATDKCDGQCSQGEGKPGEVATVWGFDLCTSQRGCPGGDNGLAKMLEMLGKVPMEHRVEDPPVEGSAEFLDWDGGLPTRFDKALSMARERLLVFDGDVPNPRGFRGWNTYPMVAIIAKGPTPIEVRSVLADQLRAMDPRVQYIPISVMDESHAWSRTSHALLDAMMNAVLYDPAVLSVEQQGSGVVPESTRSIRRAPILDPEDGAVWQHPGVPGAPYAGVPLAPFARRFREICGVAATQESIVTSERPTPIPDRKSLPSSVESHIWLVAFLPLAVIAFIWLCCVSRGVAKPRSYQLKDDVEAYHVTALPGSVKQANPVARGARKNSSTVLNQSQTFAAVPSTNPANVSVVNASFSGFDAVADESTVDADSEVVPSPPGPANAPPPQTAPAPATPKAASPRRVGRKNRGRGSVLLSPKHAQSHGGR